MLSVKRMVLFIPAILLLLSSSPIFASEGKPENQPEASAATGTLTSETFTSVLPLNVIVSVLAPAIIVPLIGVIAFGWWMKHRCQIKTDEDRVSAWDVFIKGISALTVIVAAGLSILQYLHMADEAQRAEAIRKTHELSILREELAQQTREFNINLYKNKDRQSYKETLYHEAVDVASTLATAVDFDAPDVRIARNRFHRLYFGQLIVLKEDQVRQAMTDFRDALLDWRENPKVKPKLDEPTVNKLVNAFGETNEKVEQVKGLDNESNRLEALCLLLAESCRQELEQVDRDRLYENISQELSSFIFHAELMQEWFANNWTSEKELGPIVSEYNLLVTKLRRDEHAHHPMVERFWSSAASDMFSDVMEEVRKVDEAVHSLNDEMGLVASGKKERADPNKAKQAADLAQQRVTELKPKVKEFLRKLSQQPPSGEDS